MCHLRRLILLVSLMVGLPIVAQTRTILQQAERDAQAFGTFADLAQLAELDAILNGDDLYTVLMPTNDAISIFLADNGLTQADLTADPALLRTLLDYHILTGELRASDITTAYGEQAGNTLQMTTLGGEPLTIQVDSSGTILLGGRGVAVFLPDQQVTNGIIHAISGVLLPPSLQTADGRANFGDKETIADLLGGAPEFTSLMQAITDYDLPGLLDSAEPITIFAPTNNAFAIAQETLSDDLLAILELHIIPGRWTVRALQDKLTREQRDIGTLETLSGATITYQLLADGVILLNGQGVATFVSDVVVDNGVIHYISNVMSPQADNTIGEYIRKSNDFTILETILNTTDVMDTLNSAGQYTLFAPTDTAFESLASRLNITVDDLLTSPDVLRTVVEFHVMEGDFPSEDIRALYLAEDDGLLELPTLSGDLLPVQVNDDENQTIFLNQQGVDVFLPDVITTNGRIHGLSRVMIPPSLRDEDGRPTFGTFTSIIDILNRDANSFSAFVSLLEDNGLAAVLSGTDQFTVFAPTNGAVASGSTSLETANVNIVSVLQFHIVPRRYTAESLLDLIDLETDNTLELITINGDELRLQMDNTGTIFLNAQGVVTTVVNLSASNGIVHAVSGLMLP